MEKTNPMETCKLCEGKGVRLIKDFKDSGSPFYESQTCQRCYGSGKQFCKKKKND